MFKQWLWSKMFELVTDIDPEDKTRMSGIAKPTRFAKFIERICI